MGVQPGDAGLAGLPLRPGPVASPQRIQAIDTLRGLALFGVLMVNLVTEFRVSIFAQFLSEPAAGTASDRAVMWIVSEGLETKAFSLFSLLFGVGLAIQFDRLASRPDRIVLLLRRLGALLLFGLVHLLLVWNGDILTEYAVAGFIILPLLFAPTYVVGTVSAAFLTFYAVMPLLHLPIPFPGHNSIVQHIADADRAYGHGSYAEVLRFNIKEVPSLVPLHLFVLPRTLGLFALGAWLWRVGVFLSARRGAYGTSGLIGVGLGLLLTIATAPGGLLHHHHMEAATAVADQIAPILLALGYAGLILMFATGSQSRMVVAWAGPLGRTAFTNYILQSLIFGCLFFGYGLALFDRLAPALTFAIGLSIYIGQVVVSTLWLRRFQFGPLEWLWRALMYGRAPPFRRPAGRA